MQGCKHRPSSWCWAVGWANFEQTPGHFPGQHSPLFPANRAILVQKLPYRYRLYSHPHSQAALDRAFGCSPVVWNHALALGRPLY